MIVKNKALLNPAFWGSVIGLMKIEDMEVSTKLKLVKFRREVQDHAEDVNELLKTTSLENVNELLYEIKTDLSGLDIDNYVDKLTANDLYNLSLIFQ